MFGFNQICGTDWPVQIDWYSLAQLGYHVVQGNS